LVVVVTLSEGVATAPVVVVVVVRRVTLVRVV
jgi:hypothetical protein